MNNKNVINNDKSEIVLKNKKYVVRSIFTGNSNKRLHDSLLTLAERKALKEMKIG